MDKSRYDFFGQIDGLMEGGMNNMNTGQLPLGEMDGRFLRNPVVYCNAVSVSSNFCLGIWWVAILCQKRSCTMSLGQGLLSSANKLISRS